MRAHRQVASLHRSKKQVEFGQQLLYSAAGSNLNARKFSQHNQMQKNKIMQLLVHISLVCLSCSRDHMSVISLPTGYNDLS
jgi:hypothetical protein